MAVESAAKRDAWRGCVDLLRANEKANDSPENPAFSTKKLKRYLHLEMSEDETVGALSILSKRQNPKQHPQQLDFAISFT